MQPAEQARPVEPGRWDAKYDSHFSQAFVADRFVFVSGQLATDADGNLVGGDDVAQQAWQVFENIAAILASEQLDLRSIVSVNVFVTDIEDIPRIAPVRRELFGDHRPASTAVEISRLLLPGAKLEINAVALR